MHVSSRQIIMVALERIPTVEFLLGNGGCNLVPAVSLFCLSITGLLAITTGGC